VVNNLVEFYSRTVAHVDLELDWHPHGASQLSTSNWERFC
jgi:hypothetical protein